jgi:segregation and condensation protein B
MDQALINRIVEAALLAASQPLTLVQLNGLFPLDEPAPDGAVQQALAELQAACADRGVELVEVASGWRYQVKADVHPWVARLWTERQVKYTRATLETLALIAYRQPITRGEIEQVRGVAVNSNIIKALEEREWIRVVGHRDIPGRPELLGTTKGFLDYFGLKRLDELPPLSELKDFGELEPQLEFDDAPRAVGDIVASPDGDIASPDGDSAAGNLGDGDTLDAGTADADDDTGNDLAANDDDEVPASLAGGQDDGNREVFTTTPDDGGTHTEDTALADDGDGTRSNA